MKDIVSAKWRSCKYPVAEIGGRHFFCAADLPETTPQTCFYCAEHVVLVGVYTALFSDDEMKNAVRAFTRKERIAVEPQREFAPVDELMRGGS